ncbi:MAG: cell division protein FtsZ [Sphingobacteriales bacterium]|jgi:cell division protein FtsZ
MEFELPKEKSSIIKVVGIGGGGGNAVNHMFKQGIKGVDFIVCNTDAQALDLSPVPNKIQLGESLTEGRGAGSLPEVGKNAAIENIDSIKEYLEINTKMLFLTAGMGGGTGTGASPVIAQAAKELGILTVAIVTTPFGFEGKRRREQAQKGIEELRKSVDTLLLVSNDKLREVCGNLSLSNAFAEADNILTTAAKGIAEIITVPGYINVDFEDVKTVMKESGVAIMGTGVAEGEHRAIQAAEAALSSPLLNDSEIVGANHILLNITSGTKEVLMDEISEITDFVQDAAGLTANIIWGNCNDDSLGEAISVTLIATGFKTGEEDANLNANKRHVLEPNNPSPKPTPANDGFSVRSEPTFGSENATTQQPKQPDLFSWETNIEKKESPHEEIEFTVKTVDTPTPEPQPKEQTEEPQHTENQDSAYRRTQERIAKLKGLSMGMKTSGGLNEMEEVPAYLRRQVELDDVPHSSESNVSRRTLSDDENQRPEIRSNNSFLHDNVD